jgi:hypothetical protein
MQNLVYQETLTKQMKFCLKLLINKHQEIVIQLKALLITFMDMAQQTLKLHS